MSAFRSKKLLYSILFLYATFALVKGQQSQHQEKSRTQLSYFINCGGKTKLGQLWTPSSNTSGVVTTTKSGKIYKQTIKNSKIKYDKDITQAPIHIYRTMLWTPEDYVKFKLIVEPQFNYTVQLHFMEIQRSRSKQRQFDIMINGKIRASKVNIYKEAKKQIYVPVSLEYNLQQGNSKMLSVKLLKANGNIIISGISVKANLIPEKIIPDDKNLGSQIDVPRPLADYLPVVIEPSDGLDIGLVPIGKETKGHVVSVKTIEGFVMLDQITFTSKQLASQYSFTYQLSEGSPTNYRAGYQQNFDESITIGQEGLNITFGFEALYGKKYSTTMLLWGYQNGEQELTQIAKVTIDAEGSEQESEDKHTLHPKINGPSDLIFYDYENAGEALVTLDGIDSHTHSDEAGVRVDKYVWVNSTGSIIGTGPVLKKFMPVGEHTVVLVLNETVTGNTDAEQFTFDVASLDRVPGAYATFAPVKSFEEVGKSMSAEFAVIRRQFSIPSLTLAEGVPVPYGAMLQATTVFNEPVKLSVVASKGLDYELFVNEKSLQGKQSKWVKGAIRLKLAAFVQNTTELLPELATLKVTRKNKSVSTLSDMFHNQQYVQPVIQIHPKVAATTGGSLVTVSATGVDLNSAHLFIGSEKVQQEQIKSIVSGHDGQSLQFELPPSPSGDKTSATASIQVISKDGHNRASNKETIQYVPAATHAAVSFKQQKFAVNRDMTAITYCHGHVIVAVRKDKGLKSKLVNEDFSAEIRLYKVSDDYTDWTLQHSQNVVKAGAKQNGFLLDEVLGLACDPWGTDDNFDIYFSASKLFPAGGKGVESTEPIPFTGAVFKLNSADGFTIAHPVIRNLPVSDHDHSVNGLEFLNDGTLLIAVGGNTNAGWPAQGLGSLNEGPLSGAILQAPVKKEGFNGNITYGFLEGYSAGVAPVIGTDPMDVRNSEWLTVTSGDVSVYAAGLRNPFDLTMCPNGDVFATDNGPNRGFGGLICGENERKLVDEEDPLGLKSPGTLEDELNQIFEGAYYGHPNPARAKVAGNEREWCGHMGSGGGSSEYTEPLMLLDSSSDGIACYWSEVFNGNGKGDLYIQHFKELQYRLYKNGDSKMVKVKDDVDPERQSTPGLAITTLPGGALGTAQYCASKTEPCYIVVNVPVDEFAARGEARVYQINPFRGSAIPAGDTTFEVSGANFPETGCDVYFGDVKAEVLSTSESRIRGLLPALEVGEHDVTVECAGGTPSKHILSGHHYTALQPL